MPPHYLHSQAPPQKNDHILFQELTQCPKTFLPKLSPDTAALVVKVQDNAVTYRIFEPSGCVPELYVNVLL